LDLKFLHKRAAIMIRNFKSTALAPDVAATTSPHCLGHR
jgi:hypothetical protein